MGIPVSEARPDDFSNWGDSNPNPSARIVEPPASLQQAGWVGTQKPPAPYENWINWITQRWTKNLDIRAPRIPLHKWYVGEQSGAHFPTLAAAIASGSVANGDWIYFSPSVANTTLALAITVSKSLKIMFEPGTEFTGSAANAFIVTANDVELSGASFDDSWDNANDAVIDVTGARLRVIKCNFHTANTRYIDADSVAEADQPILSQNYPESLLGVTTLDMWEWETGRQSLGSIANSSGNLLWTTDTINTLTWVAAAPVGSTQHGRFWELYHSLRDGLALKIIDGNSDVWLIVPRANFTAYKTHVTLAGAWTNGSTASMTMASAGIGVVYDVYKNGVSQANFSTFTTLNSGSMNANSFRMVLYGTSQPIRSLKNLESSPRPRKKWVRAFFTPANNAYPGANTVLSYDLKFTAGKRYRVSLSMFVTTTVETIIQMDTANSNAGTFNSATSLNEFGKVVEALNGSSLDFSFTFAAEGDGISFRADAGFTDESGFLDPGVARLAQPGYSHWFIEELP